MLLLSGLSFLMLGAAPYKAVNGLSFEETEGTVKIEKLNLDYKLHIQKSQYTADWLLTNLTAASEKLVKYAESKDYRTIECRPVDDLDIYVVDFNVLNNRERFDNYAGAESGMPIWALFDSRKDEPTTSAILLTDHGEKHNFRLLAHELAHYWSYRFCWDFYHDIEPEKMAVEFEVYAKENL